jgi:putative ABC transport system permease protein
VGGIGIMNVMLASVMQRTREIGLRLAVGASELDVQAQFLGEAVLLSLAGGLAGILLSVAGASLIGRLLGWVLAIPSQALLQALAFSLGVGVISGFYPARMAARLDPIEALRHE